MTRLARVLELFMITLAACKKPAFRKQTFDDFFAGNCGKLYTQLHTINPTMQLKKSTLTPKIFPGNKIPLSTFWIFVCPQNAMVMSSSLWSISSALVTPASPMAPRP
jgi:hypothetical protein